MTKIVLGPEIKAGSFNFYSDGSTRPLSHKNIYPIDIDGDGIDEIFFAGFETQPNTPAAYSNTSIHIFGWLNGVLQEITNKWLPNNAHKVEGVGDIAFGDFNGDGKVDVYLSAYTDMDHPVNAYELINQGNYFEKNTLGSNTWEHSVAAYDVNNDGFTDVVPVGYSNPGYIYYGSSTGLKRTILKESFGNNSFDTNGSGVAIGDFLGNGTASIIIVDAGAHDSRTILVKVDASNPEVIQYISTLPIPRLELPKYNNIANGQYTNSHDVRTRALDFNNDGLMDVIVFSRGGWNGNEWPVISEVQFLKNLGNGVFEDVTETTLIGYKNDTNISYNPIIADFNKDGLDDIYLSEGAFSLVYDSTAILLQKTNGTFVETARTELSQYVPNYGGVSNIAQGPNGNYYMIVMSNLTSNNAGIQSISSYEMSFWDIYGTANNDLLVNLSGNDQINGGDGIDTLVVSGLPSQYSFTANTPSGVDGNLTGVDGVDTLTSIEFIRFGSSLGNDQLVTNLTTSQLVDPDGNGPQLSQAKELLQGISALYMAVFSRAPEQSGLLYWMSQANKSANVFESIANGFTQHPVFTEVYGGLDNSAFVNALYVNILGGPGDVGGVNYWVNELSVKTRAQVLSSLVQSALEIDLTVGAPALGLTDIELTAAQARQNRIINKSKVGVSFAELLGSGSNLANDTNPSTLGGLQADPAFRASVEAIRNVTDNKATLDNAIANLSAAVASGNPIAFLANANTNSASYTSFVSTSTSATDKDTDTSLDMLLASSFDDAIAFSDVTIVGSVDNW